MGRGRTLVWAALGGVVALVAVVVVLIQVHSGTSPTVASSTAPPASGGSTPPSSEPAPVVTATTSSATTYLADMHPSGGLGELVNPGPVKIAGSIYPKSISFYCNVGDPTPFPAYRLKLHARRFQATVGLGAASPPQFEAGIMLNGDGRTLRTFTVTVSKPKTVDVRVRGVHTLQLECFGSGNSATGGEAVPIAWGNARVSG